LQVPHHTLTPSLWNVGDVVYRQRRGVSNLYQDKLPKQHPIYTSTII
jgi:hypothetical protein